MPEYRPCIVTETIYPMPGMQGISEHKKHNALFHQWIKRIKPLYDESPIGNDGLIARKYLGNDELLIAIVEYEDGSIHEHLPHEIQFTDGIAEKNPKNKKSDWNKLTDDTDSFPEIYEYVLFKTSDGRIYYGCCDVELEWQIELENERTHYITDVVAWRALD